MRKIKLIPLLTLLFFVACSEIPEGISTDKVSYELFLDDHLMNQKRELLDFVKSAGAEKEVLAVEIINKNNGTNLVGYSDLGNYKLKELSSSIIEEVEHIPNIKNLDNVAFQLFKSDFKEIGREEIDFYEDHLTRYYLALIEYRAISKFKVQDNQIGDSRSDIYGDDAPNLCWAELLYLAWHVPLKGAFEDAWNKTERLMDEWYPGLNKDDISPNAVKHALWNYNIAYEVSSKGWPIGSHNIGLRVAEDLTTIHEQNGCSPTAHLPWKAAMDLRNNRLGRILFDANPSLSEAELKETFFEMQADAWPAPENVALINVKPGNNLVYINYIDSSGNRQACSEVVMSATITANRPYNGPDLYSWVPNISGNVGGLTYKWYWNNQLMTTSPNMLLNVTDNMFSNGYATVRLDVRSSTHQRTIKTISVRKNNSIRTIGSDPEGPIG